MHLAKGLGNLPNYSKVILPSHECKDLRNEIPRASLSAAHLLQGFLAYDPTKRLSAREALEHPYFQVDTCFVEHHLAVLWLNLFFWLSKQVLLLKGLHYKHLCL